MVDLDPGFFFLVPFGGGCGEARCKVGWKRAASGVVVPTTASAPLCRGAVEAKAHYNHWLMPGGVAGIWGV